MGDEQKPLIFEFRNRSYQKSDEYLRLRSYHPKRYHLNDQQKEKHT